MKDENEIPSAEAILAKQLNLDRLSRLQHQGIMRAMQEYLEYHLTKQAEFIAERVTDKGFFYPTMRKLIESASKQYQQ